MIKKMQHQITMFKFKTGLIFLIAASLFLFEFCTLKNNDQRVANSTFEVINFDATYNFMSGKEKVKTIGLDYENALKGFVIPSINQVDEGFFKLRFELKNVSQANQKFYYKIYYENISYKFNEFDTISKSEHILAHENFYGSWENTDITFRQVNGELSSGSLITVEDSFRIVGNPRNELRYFSDGKNDRWKRNPRVGNYQIKLVVCTEKDLKQIPDEVQNISHKKNDKFANPFYYYAHGDGKKLKETLVVNDPVLLNVYAKPDLGSGIYINENSFGNENFDKSYFCKTCGIAPFGKGSMPDGTQMRAINARCLDNVDVKQFPVTEYDGKSL